MRIRRLLAASLLTGLLAAVGCGSKFACTDAAEGTLTLDGAPVPNALVQFVPQVAEGLKAPTCSGTTDAKGFFKLTRGDNQKPGAVVGKNKVIVFPGRAAADRDNPGTDAPSPVPAAYMSAAKTPLSVDVTADRKTYDVKKNRAGLP